MTKIGKHFIVSGHVQGVFYRRFTQRQALELGITGSVCNVPNGDVEVKAYGTQEQLDTLEKHLWQGPINATVTHITVEEIPVVSSTDFEIQ